MQSRSQRSSPAVRAQSSCSSGRIGDPERELAAETEGVDLMIAGSRGYGPHQAVLLGSVSGRLVRDASCPVLVVPRGIETPLEDLFLTAPGALAV